MLLRLPLAPLALVTLAGIAACPSAPARPGDEVVHAPPPRDAPDTPRYRELVTRADAAIAARDYAGAIALADEALRLRPFDVAAGVAKIEAHLALGERIPAVDFAARLHAAHPDRPEPAYAHGKALYALGRILDARDAFGDALEVAPNDRPSLVGFLTALVHDETIAYDEIKARADELNNLNGPTPDADALHALAVMHELRGDTAAAEMFYLRAIEARAHHPFAHLNLGRLLQAMGRADAARPHLQAFIDQAPPFAAREVESSKKLLEETRHD